MKSNRTISQKMAPRRDGPLRSKTRPRIIVFGILFWYPLAGVTFQFLHFLLGLRRLGYDPYYIEDCARWVYDPRINDISPDVTGNIATVLPALKEHGLADRWAFRATYPGGKCYGMSESEVLRLYREADAFLNVTGAQDLRSEHMVCPRRIYLETDPVAAQIRIAQGRRQTIDALAAHHVHFSYGENFGAPDCKVPIERFRWIPTRQPVLLDFWRNRYRANGWPYTTVATWKNENKDIVYKGKRYYWSKHREFMKFIDLPQRRQVGFELAVGKEGNVQRTLKKYGWGWTDSVALSSDLVRYRNYILHSRGEFTVAKDQNIRLRSGWFSDRSACYLAAGRPVITQETGFSNCLPTGRGLFGFETMNDILAAVDKIETDYEAHSRAAREIAEEHFAAEKVLGKLMQQAGL
jgi:hypothetical protein